MTSVARGRREYRRPAGAKRSKNTGRRCESHFPPLPYVARDPSVELFRQMRIPMDSTQQTSVYRAVVGIVRLVERMGAERVEKAALPMCLLPSPWAPGQTPGVLSEAIFAPSSPIEVARVHAEDRVLVPRPRSQELAPIEALLPLSSTACPASDSLAARPGKISFQRTPWNCARKASHTRRPSPVAGTVPQT